MTQRIFDVLKWTCVEEDAVLPFPDDRPRPVRLDVNAPAAAELYYVSEDGEVRFLATVDGRDTVEFTTAGRFSLAVRGNECWIYTVDGKDTATETIDPVIFTKIVERRRRSPELVKMELAMYANMNKRMEVMEREIHRGILRRERAVEALAAAQALAGSDRSESESDDPDGDASEDGAS